MIKRKEILTAKEVAEYLDIHPLTVHRYAREGKIPAFKIGTDWRFHKKHIEKWIKQKVSLNFDNRKQNVSILEKV
jgi:excisionase family DNA binding protein